jgi:O-antigen ligase
MSTVVRSALAACVLLFLVGGDIWFPPGSSWPLVRVPLLAAAAAASLALVSLRPSLLRALVRPPTVFFVAFAAVDVVASAAAEHPYSCLRYAVGYVVVALVATSLAGVFSERWLLRGLLATVTVKVAVSLAFLSQPFAWWLGRRFQGVLGSPNPMGAAAGLAYLLLMVHGWYDWPTGSSRKLVAAAALMGTTTLALTHSASAMAATVIGLGAAAALGTLRTGTTRARVLWVAVAVVLLAPPILLGNGGVEQLGSRIAPPERALELRLRWWSMLVPVALRHPWLGYGAGSTTSFALPDQPVWATSAHNLYLEAAIYAGVPAALLMLLFVAGAVLLSIRRAIREADAARAAVAGILMFYAALSLVEPVVLNGTPSSLLVPLVAAAVCARPLPGAREGR